MPTGTIDGPFSYEKKKTKGETKGYSSLKHYLFEPGDRTKKKQTNPKPQVLSNWNPLTNTKPPSPKYYQLQPQIKNQEFNDDAISCTLHRQRSRSVTTKLLPAKNVSQQRRGVTNLSLQPVGNIAPHVTYVE